MHAVVAKIEPFQGVAIAIKNLQGEKASFPLNVGHLYDVIISRNKSADGTQARHDGQKLSVVLKAREPCHVDNNVLHFSTPIDGSPPVVQTKLQFTKSAQPAVYLTLVVHDPRNEKILKVISCKLSAA